MKNVILELEKFYDYYVFKRPQTKLNWMIPADFLSLDDYNISKNTPILMA
jgi:hypothetical protein